jgi:hypothetical protein
LTVCAQHYEGLFWLIAFYALLASLPTVSRLLNAGSTQAVRGDQTPTRQSLTQTWGFVALWASMIYVCGTLPCGRFYYEGVEGFFGNTVTRLSYQYIYIFLGAGVHFNEAVERRLAGLISQVGGLLLSPRECSRALESVDLEARAGAFARESGSEVVAMLASARARSRAALSLWSRAGRAWWANLDLGRTLVRGGRGARRR